MIASVGNMFFIYLLQTIVDSMRKLYVKYTVQTDRQADWRNW